MIDASRKAWPWLMGVAIAALAIGLMITVTERGDAPEPEPAPAASPDRDTVEKAPIREPVTGAAVEDIQARIEEMRVAVRDYQQQCLAGLESAAGEGLRAVVADCVQFLGTAVDAVVASDTVGSVAVDERLESYREEVRRLGRIPPGEGRAEPTRRVLTSAAEVLTVVRDERYTESLAGDPSLEELRDAARSLAPERPLSAQQHRVQRFFLAAGALLSAMARPGDPGPG